MAAGLESHVVGFVLRQQIVHEVRNEFEQICGTVQSPELLQNLPLPLANERVNWPLKNMLCFPTFSAKEQSSVGCHDDQSPVCKPDEGIPPLSTSGIQTSTPKHRSVAELVSHTPPKTLPLTSSLKNSSNGPDNEIHLDQPSLESAMTSFECMMTSLPRDREALLELRSQLALELLWVKQAIASRQEYLQLKQHLHTEHAT